MICECPAYAAARISVFGAADPPLSVLQAEPHRVMRYLQRIRRYNDAPNARRRAMRATRTEAAAAAPGGADQR